MARIIFQHTNLPIGYDVVMYDDDAVATIDGIAYVNAIVTHGDDGYLKIDLFGDGSVVYESFPLDGSEGSGTFRTRSRRPA